MLCYGCETWILTQVSANMLNAFERRVLRRIVGAKREGDRLRVQYNYELYELYDEPEVSKIISYNGLATYNE